MTADEVLQVIRRDIGQQIQMALQFKLSNHVASNIRNAREVSIEVEAWLDSLLKNNQLAGYRDGLYEGTTSDWVERYNGAALKLDKIREVLDK